MYHHDLALDLYHARVEELRLEAEQSRMVAAARRRRRERRRGKVNTHWWQWS